MRVNGLLERRRILRLSVIREAGFEYDPRFSLLGPNVFLTGYWQSYRYFEDVSSDLRRVTSVVAGGMDSRNLRLLEEIRSKPSVGVHVRRGDYLHEPYLSLHGVCNLDYYRRSMDRLRAEIPGCRFYVFSDDTAWCQLAFGADAIVVSHNGPQRAHIDMVLMAGCQRHIISNSSLGWWAAYLAERPQGAAIAPVPWFRNRSTTPDLLPLPWELRSRATGEPLSAVTQQVARTRVSVVVPARNRPAMLKEAIGSIMRQTKPASEIIIVLSDASVECTAVAHDLAHRSELKVVTISEPNLAKARNAGIAIATGDWIAYLDDDDIWTPEKLDRQLTAAYLLDVGVVSCDFSFFNENGDLPDHGLKSVPKGISLAEALILGNYVSGGSAAIVRADILKRVDGFDERLPACEDLDLWRRIVWKNTIAILSDKLVRIRRHEGQMSGAETLMRDGRRRLFAKMCADTPRELRHMLFPTGLFYWYKGWGVSVRDFVSTLPEFLANPSVGFKLTCAAARSMVKDRLGRTRRQSGPRTKVISGA